MDGRTQLAVVLRIRTPPNRWKLEDIYFSGPFDSMNQR